MGRKKRMRSVPRGYRHDWRYRGRWRERKVGRGKWKFDFRARKSRSVPAKSMGSVKKGDKITWRVRGTQTVTKVSKDQYSTRLVGSKKLVGVKKKGG